MKTNYVTSESLSKLSKNGWGYPVSIQDVFKTKWRETSIKIKQNKRKGTCNFSVGILGE